MITPEQLYERAKNLAKTNNEIEQRESIRLFYYANFHFIKAVCLKKQYILPDVYQAASHKNLIEAINPTKKDRKARIVVEKAKRMKERRKKADYKLDETITENDIKSQARDALQCWNELKAMTLAHSPHLKFV